MWERDEDEDKTCVFSSWTLTSSLLSELSQFLFTDPDYPDKVYSY